MGPGSSDGTRQPARGHEPFGTSGEHRSRPTLYSPRVYADPRGRTLNRNPRVLGVGVGFYALAFLGLGAAVSYGVFPLPVFSVAVVVLTLGENPITIPQATLPSNVAPMEEVGGTAEPFRRSRGRGSWPRSSSAGSS